MFKLDQEAKSQAEGEEDRTKVVYERTKQKYDLLTDNLGPKEAHVYIPPQRHKHKQSEPVPASDRQ